MEIAALLGTGRILASNKVNFRPVLDVTPGRFKTFLTFRSI